MTPIEEMELTHNTIIEKYKSNKEIYNFIKKFFTPEKGLRPLTIQKRYPQRTPIRYFPSCSKRMLQFNEISIDVLKKFKGQLHFLECIFDKRIKDMEFLNNEHKTIEPKEIFNQCVIGISPCIEIDYHINGETIFNKYKEAMYLKCMIEDKINENRLKYNSLFSGNGFYTIIQSCYFKDYKTDLESVKQNLHELETELNNKIKKTFTIPPIPIIDTTMRYWGIYKKAPFTYHNKYNRVAVPIPNGEIDIDYLNTISNFDNFIKSDTNDIKDIINKAMWSEIW